jgi:DNA-binding response OmpR family regulator
MAQADTYSILVADESGPLRDDLKSILDGQGHRTLLADCGARALEILDSQKVHLSIVEMNLPDYTGLEIVNFFKIRNRTVPFIFLSEYFTTDQQIQALDAGAETLLIRPPDREIFTATVNHVLEKLFEGGKRNFPYTG